jgi:hypothetical protein
MPKQRKTKTAATKAAPKKTAKTRASKREKDYDGTIEEIDADDGFVVEHTYTPRTKGGD